MPKMGVCTNCETYGRLFEDVCMACWRRRWS